MWYHSDDYYFRHIGKVEVNIKSLNNEDIGLWIYDHNTNTELENSSYKDLDQLKEMILKHTGVSINPPNHQQLKKIRS